MTGDYGAGPFLSSLEDDTPHSEPRIDSNLRDMYLSTQQFPDGALRRPKSFSSNQEVAYHAPNIQSLPHISTHDLHDTVDTSTVLSSATTEPPSAVSHSSHVDSPTTGTEQWSKDSQSAPAPPTRQPKSRREKPHIELAPDQPPTTQGKARARVYVACVQCRTRKIRCDGANPVCHNCSRRTTASGGPCSYDSAPKRRGPDKTPGARQRTAREISLERREEEGASRRRRRRRDPSIQKPDVQDDRVTTTKRPAPYEIRKLKDDLPLSPVPMNPISALSTAPFETWGNLTSDFPKVGGQQNHNRNDQLCRAYGPSIDGDSPVFTYINDGRFSGGYYEPLFEEDEIKIFNIAAEPSLDLYRKTWWDCLLATYSTSSSCADPMSLSATEREHAATLITADLRFLFRTANYWMSFIHVPRFFSAFFNPVTRDSLQPSLIIVACALSIMWQSSEIGRGKAGRDLALQLHDQAQGALQASLNAGWIDDNLAIAAWMLAMFEISAHPQHSNYRAIASMHILDQIIHTLSLTTIDANDPNASTFALREVPRVITLRHPSPQTSDESDLETSPGSAASSHDFTHEGCDCASLSLGHQWPGAFEHAPLWLSTPAWNENWDEGEFRKETCRRLCWSTVILAAGISSYTTAEQAEGLDLFVTEAANFALLFPGESVDPSKSSKNSIWALNYRTMLLWNSCVRMCRDNRATDAERARFGMAAWLEVDELEAALNGHTCGLERAFLFQGREYLFNTRMCISYEFQRYLPLAAINTGGHFHRRKAEEWLTHQATVAKQVMFGLHTVTGQGSNGNITQRPFFVFWFMSQINRALSLWDLDRTLTVALEVSKTLLAPIDQLSAIWPCPAQRLRYSELRQQLDQACLCAGLPLPPPQNLLLQVPPAPLPSVVSLSKPSPPTQLSSSPLWDQSHDSRPARPF
ncbi:hypothetical protein FIBSPDRAFT_773133 [Athelia psychrophila]|uniref:Zn(2)-C6 fungal-type domain-containing protein n=1 Tax=Athelia psychrophila TaxID=1759441 RepID=A0A166W7F5_9AGAM|nr:hypothetical protein FIBSPDRAFT_773133 [Fibularhizoctonia sp. CBS 109695]